MSEQERSELCSNYGGFCKKEWVGLMRKLKPFMQSAMYGTNLNTSECLKPN